MIRSVSLDRNLGRTDLRWVGSLHVHVVRWIFFVKICPLRRGAANESHWEVVCRELEIDNFDDYRREDKGTQSFRKEVHGGRI